MKKENILFALLVVSQISFGQCPEYDLQPPHLSNVVVKAFVSQDGETRIFTYRYSITNGPASTGCINRFEMDIKAPTNGLELSNVGLVDYPRYVDRSALQSNPILRIIPVGIPKLPRFKGFSSAWFAGFSIDGRIDWFRAIKSYRLEPGETIDSLLMTSHGLPSLRAFVISPSYNPMPPVIITPDNEDSVRMFVPPPTREEEEAFQRLQDSIKIRGATIGPTAPPANFVAIAFLDTLISYKHQAINLGWITNKGILNSLDQKLDNARKQLQRGNNKTAKNILEAFINEVEAQKDKHLSSEAYALLKYNAQYLLSKLQ